MQVALNKWGNSVGLRMPNSILLELGIGCGNKLEIKVENGKVIMEQVDDKKDRLAKLLKAIKPDNLHGEAITGVAVGNEII
jgi:transcriptional regulator/antitoxin, mazE